LRIHCIPDTWLRDVFRATVIAKLMYMLTPSWSGACSAADPDRAKLESFNYQADVKRDLATAAASSHLGLPIMLTHHD